MIQKTLDVAGLAISNALRPGLAMTVKSLGDELGPRGIRITGLSGDWRMFNPVVRAERIDLPAGQQSGRGAAARAPAMIASL